MKIKSAPTSNSKSIFIVTGILLINSYLAVVLSWPLPPPKLNLTKVTSPINTTPTEISWPSAGGSAVGAVGYGLLQANGKDEPMPTASIAKVILAMAILQKKPLALNDTGPIIKITDQDLEFYNQEIARNGSTVAVQAGEELTEYQALQALLLPSGNNIASTLAVWAFGSEANYLDYSKEMLAKLKLSKTIVADASGYSEQTVSTPSELVLIGLEAIKNPVIKQIVNQETATIPVAGKITNVNWTLGKAGINGIKTGNTDLAGGCLLFSADKKINNQTITLVGAIQSLPNLHQALLAAPDLATSGLANFVSLKIADQGEIFGRISTSWGKSSNLVATEGKQIIIWTKAKHQQTVTATAGLEGDLGAVKIDNSTVRLKLDHKIAAADWWWRVSHPLELIAQNF